MSSIDFIELMKPYIINYPFLLVFLLSLFGGETLFILLAFLAGTTGLIPMWILFISGTAAVTLNDVFWFSLPRLKIFNKIKIPKFLINSFKKNNYKFRKIEEKGLLIFILINKFLFGTRNLSIFSISLNKINFWKFLLNTALASMIWGFVIITIGWLTGKGFIIAKEIFDSTRIALTILFFFILLIIFIRYNIHKRAKKKIIINK